MSNVIKADRLLFDKGKHAPSEVDGEQIADSEREELSLEEEHERLYNETKSKLLELLEENKAEARKIEEEAKTEAAKIVAAAREEAEKIRLNTAKEIEEQKAEVLKKAAEDGRAEGLAALQDKQEKADNLIMVAEREKKEIILTAEKEILDLSVKIAEKVIHGALQTEKKSLKKMVKSYLEMVQNAKKIVLKANADDHYFLERRLQEMENYVPHTELVLEVDSTLKSGDFLLISDNGIIEARIDEKLEKIKQVLSEVYAND